MGVVRTGSMRLKVEVQKYTPTQAADGGSIRAWATENTVWASLIPAGGAERQQADQAKAVRKFTIFMRFYSPGITEADRIKMGTRLFGITAIVDVGERGCNTILDVLEGVKKDE